MKEDRLRVASTRNYTPLRYPGGKAKLASFVKDILRKNDLADGHYVEPFAGGAGLALELLLQGFVNNVSLNDISVPVWSFWHSVLHHTEELVRLICDTPVNLTQWDKQKAVISNPSEHDTPALGFSLFYLNRTNRSGILNGGMIGGRSQEGLWKIDARYNKSELLRRVVAIANNGDRISLSNQDALVFIKSGMNTWCPRTLIYLDPPYYVKGRSLYLDCYKHQDHVALAELMKGSHTDQRWIVSYDNVPQIQDIYGTCAKAEYSLNYSAREAGRGKEVMFFKEGLIIPQLTSAMHGFNSDRAV